MGSFETIVSGWAQIKSNLWGEVDEVICYSKPPFHQGRRRTLWLVKSIDLLACRREWGASYDILDYNWWFCASMLFQTQFQIYKSNRMIRTVNIEANKKSFPTSRVRQISPCIEEDISICILQTPQIPLNSFMYIYYQEYLSLWHWDFNIKSIPNNGILDHRKLNV